MNVQEIFPTQVGLSVCDIDIESEIQYLRNLEMAEPSEEVILSYGYRSENTSVLDDPQVYRLRNWIIDQLDRYAIEILGYDVNGMGITQSWITQKASGQTHMPHKHPNSLISGVFYFEDHEAAMTFTDERTECIHVEKRQNAPNNQFSIQPLRYGLVLFPSWVLHGVGKNTGPVRTSLAFNTLPLNGFGDIGDCRNVSYNNIKGKL